MTKLTKSGLNPQDFEATVDEKDVKLFVLTNSNGVEACITNYGGRIVSLMVPDREGKLTDVELGHDSIANYLADDGNFGALIGRYGNRIGRSQGCSERESRGERNGRPNHMKRKTDYDNRKQNQSDRKRKALFYVSVQA